MKKHLRLYCRHVSIISYIIKNTNILLWTLYVTSIYLHSVVVGSDVDITCGGITTFIKLYT